MASRVELFERDFSKDSSIDDTGETERLLQRRLGVIRRHEKREDIQPQPTENEIVLLIALRMNDLSGKRMNRFFQAALDVENTFPLSSKTDRDRIKKAVLAKIDRKLSITE